MGLSTAPDQNKIETLFPPPGGDEDMVDEDKTPLGSRTEYVAKQIAQRIEIIVSPCEADAADSAVQKNAEATVDMPAPLKDIPTSIPVEEVVQVPVPDKKIPKTPHTGWNGNEVGFGD